MPPPTGGRGIMLSGPPSVCPSVRPSVCLCVRPCVRSALFVQYLQYQLMDLHQTFVISVPWGKDELIIFWVQKVKGQGHSWTKYGQNHLFWPILSPRNIFR